MNNTTVMLVANVLFTLAIGYAFIMYTKEMREHPTCKMVSSNKRELVYLMGIVIISHVLLNLILLVVF